MKIDNEGSGKLPGRQKTCMQVKNESFPLCMHAKSLQSFLTLCDPMDLACQGPLSMGFSRQEYWSGLPGPPSEDLPNPRIEPVCRMSPALADVFFTINTAWEAQ